MRIQENRYFTHVLPLLLCCFGMFGGQVAMAQEVTVDNAVISVSGGTFLSTTGGVTLQNTGGVDNGGTVQLNGDWTNQANGLVNGSAGTVELSGGNQTVGGANSTTFHNLTLTGTGIKSLAIDATVTNILALNDRELNTGSHTMFVTNPDSGAITFTTGFVNSGLGGALSRFMDAVSTFVFPVGIAGTFRPVEISPNVAGSQAYTVRFVPNDPDTDGYSRSINDGSQCAINSNYYHLINRTSGSTSSDISIYYAQADGGFNNLVKWQGLPMWNTMAPVSALSNYGLLAWKKAGWSNFSFEPIALSIADTVAPLVTCPANQTVSLDGNCSALLEEYITLAVATDNCTAVTLSQSPVLGTALSGVGSTTVTITATDGNGNTANCTFNVLRVDDTPPTITCPADITVNNHITECGATVHFAAVALDNCGIDSIAYSPACGAFYPVGVTTVSSIATDLSGNTAACSFLVTVVDVQNPTITCPADIQVGTDPGQCNAVVSYGSATASDNCSVTGISYSHASGGTFALGHTTVTAIASDPAGNTAACTFEITVSDNENPVITCPADTSVVNDPGQCSAVVTFSATASDNCALTGISYSPPSGTAFPLFSTTVTATATDAAGNTASCTFHVFVADLEAPVALCQNAFVTLDGNGNASITAAQIDNGSHDNCGIRSLNVSPSTFNCSNVGANTVTLTVFDIFGFAGNSNTCTAILIVLDNTAPTAICQNITVQAGSTGAVSVSASQINNGSSDNCGIASMTVSPSTFTCGNAGANTVVLTVTDGSANVSTCSATVTVQTAPIAVTLSSPVNGCGYNVSACCATNGNGSGSGSDNHHGSGSDHGCGSGRGHGSGHHGGYNCRTAYASGEMTFEDLIVNGNRINSGRGHGSNGHGNCGSGSGRGHGSNGHGNCGSGSGRGHGSNGHGNCGSGSGRGHGSNGHGSIPCGNDGCITAAVSGGCAPYTYNWSNGAHTATQCGLSAGLYSVTVTDGNGATTVRSIILTQAPNLTATATATSVTCNGSHNGSVTATPIGGCGPYTYHWNTGSNAQTLNGLNPGTYHVTITSAGGCTATASATVTQPTRLVVNAGANQVVYPAFQPQACATLTGSVRGGTPAYSRQWKTRSGQVLGTGNSVSVCPTVNTVYFFHVTDANGCSGFDSVLVCARNITCGSGRIQICHRPPGSHSACQTQCLPVNQVASHLQHGDYLGACNSNYQCEFPRGRGGNNNCKTDEQAAAAEDQGIEVSVRAFPNPTSGDLTLQLACMGCTEDAIYAVTVTDLAGQIVLKSELSTFAGEGVLQLDLSRFSTGTYLLILQNGLTRHVERVVKQ